VAVAVEQAPYVVLDEEYRIVEADESAQPVFGSFLGQIVWDCFPDSRPLYQPYYETARRTGAPVKFAQFFNGYVMLVRATPLGRGIALTYDVLGLLDVLTLDGLRVSLDNALTKLAEAEELLRRERARGSLSVIGGGA